MPAADSELQDAIDYLRAIEVGAGRFAYRTYADNDPQAGWYVFSTAQLSRSGENIVGCITDKPVPMPEGWAPDTQYAIHVLRQDGTYAEEWFSTKHDAIFALRGDPTKAHQCRYCGNKVLRGYCIHEAAPGVSVLYTIDVMTGDHIEA